MYKLSRKKTIVSNWMGLVLILSTLFMLVSAIQVSADFPIGYQKISDTEGGFTAILDDGDRFGATLTEIGDLDGDGIPDLAVGAWGDADGGHERGAVYILFLNSDGTVNYHQKISSTEGDFDGDLRDGDNFGYAIEGLDDFDGDGVQDLAVGASWADDGGLGRGAFFMLFMNPDGSVKSSLKFSDHHGNFTGLLDDWDVFGHSLADLGDLDGDGLNDLAVGATGDDDGGVDRGAVYIMFMQADGTVKAHQKISDTEGALSVDFSDYDHFGTSVSSLGDMDGDGITDIAVGSTSLNSTGYVLILFLNNDGTVKNYQKITNNEGNLPDILDIDDYFGWSLASIGDRDNNGVVDLAVGAPGDDDGGDAKGAVYILYLDSTGRVNYYEKMSEVSGHVGDLEEGGQFGVSIANIGDLSRDGGWDIAYGAGKVDDGGLDRGAVYIHLFNGEEHIVAHPQWDPSAQDWYQDQIDGLGWEIGTWVTLEIDDPSNGPGLDYSEDQEAHETEIEERTVSFMLGEFDLQPGHQITMYNEEVTKTHVVQSQEITEIDVETDVITGTADPGTEVMVWFEYPEPHEIIVVANEFGDWTANFSGIADIGYGTWGAAAVNEPLDSASHTRYNWDFSNTHLEATITYDHIQFTDFTPSNTITLEIYDSPGGGWIYDDVVGTDGCGFAFLDLWEVVDLYPGTYIWAHDDATNLVKDLELRYLTLDYWDPGEGLVEGTADPFEEVQVGVYTDAGPEEYLMTVSADGVGYWTADFPENFTDEYWPAVRIYDEDRDELVTEFEYQEPPTLAGSLVYDWIELRGFEPEAEVTLNINGEDFYVTTWEDGFYWMDRYEHMINLEPGTVITASQGDLFKELTLLDISITGVDYGADFVTGTALEGYEIEVNVFNEGTGEGFGMPVVAGPGNLWTANFAEDITEEMWMSAYHYDDDKDATVAELPPTPFLIANIDRETVFSTEWPIGVEVYLTVLGLGEDYVSEPMITEPLFDPFSGSAIFELAFDLQPGHYVFLTGEGFIKEHTVTDFQVISFDLNADTISGTAPPGSTAFVAVLGENGEWLEVQRWVEADPSGNWTADFSVPGPNKGEENTWDLQETDQGIAQVSDDDGDATEVDWMINYPPEVDVGGPYAIDEGSPLTLSPTVVDPEDDELTYLWSYEPVDGVCSFNDPTVRDTIFTCMDNGLYQIELVVWDGVNDPVNHLNEVSVLNVAPVIGLVNGPVNPVPLGEEINVSAAFTDPGALDEHTSLWDWGDGSLPSEGVIDSYTIYGTHTYDAPGIYVFAVEVCDDDMGCDMEIFQYVVIYDPSGGFVTGGGWINSPEGAYVDDPSLSGKANFGFMAKYKKDSNVPTGETEFHLKSAGLKFHSDGYMWLIVSGRKAMYKGTGSINGNSGFGFMLSCYDGDLENGDGIDRIRMKIWDIATGQVIYDNLMGAPDGFDPVTELGGGSIKIHKKN